MASVDHDSVSGEGNPRKRLRISRSVGQAAMNAAHIEVQATSSSSTLKQPAGSGCVPKLPSNGDGCHHERALKALHTDFDAMRSLITCQICHRLMYEPYALACGHTYCYSCLSQWLGGNRKKTCPDCRAAITHPPNPSYVIRELVLIFVSKSELLPHGETPEEHDTLAKEEADIIAKDKANVDPHTGGLFKGCFKLGRHVALLPLHDSEDGVDRCPQCNWEVEDGYCQHCNVRVGDEEHLGFSDYSGESFSTDDELDHDLDELDEDVAWRADGEDDDREDGMVGSIAPFDPEILGFAAHNNPPRPPIRSITSRRARRTRPPVSLASVSISSDGISDDEDARDPSIDRFIDGGLYSDLMNGADSNDSDVTEVRRIPSRPRPRRRAPVIISDDDEDDDGDGETLQSSQPAALSVADSDGEGQFVHPHPTDKRTRSGRGHPIAISSDEEWSDEEHECVVHDGEQDFQLGGFSPIHESAAGSGIYNPADEAYETTSSVHPMEAFYSDAESDGDDEEEGEEEGGEENGWDTRAETPSDVATFRAARHRLQNSMPSPGRHAHAPMNALQRQSLPSGTHVGQPNGMFRPTAPSYAPRPPVVTPQHHLAPEPAPQPFHPFNLSSTLARINTNHRDPQRSGRRSGSAHRGSSRPGNFGSGAANVRSSASGGSRQTLDWDGSGAAPLLRFAFQGQEHPARSRSLQY